MKLLVRSTSVGLDKSYVHRQTEQTLIRQLRQELPDLRLLYLQESLEASFCLLSFFANIDKTSGHKLSDINEAPDNAFENIYFV